MAITLNYYPVNIAWGFILHEDGKPAHTGLPIPMNGQRWFRSRHDAVSAARDCGLEVDIRDRVVTKDIHRTEV